MKQRKRQHRRQQRRHNMGQAAGTIGRQSTGAPQTASVAPLHGPETVLSHPGLHKAQRQEFVTRFQQVQGGNSSAAADSRLYPNLT